MNSMKKTMSNKTRKRKQTHALQIMRELGAESNAHGLAKIATSGTTKRKVLWSLLVIIGFTAATLQLSFLVKKFLSYQVVEVSNMKEGMPVEFPSVTICNINTISLAKVQELLSDNTSDIEEWLQFINDTNFGQHKARMNSHQAFYENLPTIARLIGHKIENFVVYCRFNNEHCGPHNFSLFFDGKNYYNCYTFNSGTTNGQKLLMHTTGPQNGLSLIISLDNENSPAGSYGIYDLGNHIAFSAGVRAQVHAPNTMPSPADHGFDVPPGYSTSVGLKAILHSRLPNPYGNCTFDHLEGERNYMNTIFTCFQLCKQKILVKNCGCKTSALPMYQESDQIKKDIPYCGAIKDWKNQADMFKSKQKVELMTLMCEETVLKILNNNRTYENSCGCSQPCKETAYQKSLSLSYWPLEFYQYSALQEFYKEQPMTTSLIREAFSKLSSIDTRYSPYAAAGLQVEYNLTDLNDINRASTLIRQNLIRLNIYLEDLSIIEFTQMPAYGVPDLFADIGGTLGLWLGISVLTVMELIELIMTLILMLFNSEADMTGGDSEKENEAKHTVFELNNSVLNIPQIHLKYNHFQYDRPLFPWDRHGEAKM